MKEDGSACEARRGILKATSIGAMLSSQDASVITGYI